MNNEVMFSSSKQDWETPQWLFDKLNRTFGFEMDVCANFDNTKCAYYLTEKEDGLTSDWEGCRCWMNPPYGRTIGKWVEKASSEASKGCLVVALLPARVDTKWFQEYVFPFADVHFLKGRLKFEGAKSSAPFPSCIAIYSGLKK